jgi:hypothetical protein
MNPDRDYSQDPGIELCFYVWLFIVLLLCWFYIGAYGF